MCGIAGVCTGDARSPDAAVLNSMIRRIRHRGVDGVGVESVPGCGLAHTRLSIVDHAGGHQPMFSADGRYGITFNGEIYNHAELRAFLVREGYSFTTRSDTEVLLHLFAHQREECVHVLNGQWAFAIWDARERVLFASRDRMGVRPFFYALSGNTFLFASEMKAVLTFPDIPREIDEIALQQISIFWHTIPPRTIFKGLSELPPAHSLIFDDGRVTVKRHWHLTYGGGTKFAEDDAAAQLSNLLCDATRLRLRSDTPVGAYVSGGLDSSIVAALMRRVGGRRFQTFSLRFNNAAFDEGLYQQLLVAELDSEHHEIYCSSADIARRLPQAIWHIEQPIVRLAPVPLLMLSELARASGCKVVMTGEGADEIFGGYDIFKESKVRQFCARNPESRWRPLLLRRLYPYLSSLQHQSDPYLRAFFDSTHDQGNTFFSHGRRWSVGSRLAQFFSKSLRARLRGHDPIAELASALPPEYNTWDEMSRAQYVETAWFLPGVILAGQGDRVGMAHAVEGRFPFLDTQMVEFANALPPNLKLRVLCEKYLLKRSTGGLVPAAINGRVKQPYRAPNAGRIFVEHCPPYVNELLRPERVAADGIFDATAVSCLLQKLAAGRIQSAADNMALTMIISTQLLVHSFIYKSDTPSDYADA